MAAPGRLRRTYDDRVAENWIVDREARAIEVFDLLSGSDVPARFTEGQRVVSRVLPDAVREASALLVPPAWESAGR